MAIAAKSDETEDLVTCFKPPLESKTFFSVTGPIQLQPCHGVALSCQNCIQHCSGCTSCTEGKAMFSQKHGNCGALTRCTCNNCIYSHETQTGTGMKYPLGSQNPNKGLKSNTTVKYKSAIYPFPGKQRNVIMIVWLKHNLKISASKD